MKVIDTHAHFWDTEKFNYRWIEKSSFYDRPFLLTDYRQASRNVPIEKIVFVECNCHPEYNLEEVKWVQDCAVTDPRIKGIVAYAQLTDTATLDSKLDILSDMDLVKAIRHNIQFNEYGFALQEDFIKGIKKVSERQLHFELCITHDQLAETIELVKQCPDVQFVLDHCAKPCIRAGSKEPWRSQLYEIARFENVVCKISGLLTEANPKAWSAEEILFYADHAATAFGISRIMFGSDWPVSEAAGGYYKWYEVMQELTAPWTKDERDDFFFNNANRIYRLGE